MERKPSQPGSGSSGKEPARPASPGALKRQMPANRPTPASSSGPNIAVQAASAAPHNEEPLPLGERLKEWFVTDASPYMISAIVHCTIFLVLALTLGYQAIVKSEGDAPKFEEVAIEKEDPAKKEDEPEVKPFDLTEPPDLEPSEIDLTQTLPKAQEAQDAVYFDESKEFEEAGGGGFKDSEKDQPKTGGDGTDFKAIRPGVASKGRGGVGSAPGFGDHAGVGGDGSGFGGRGKGSREAMVGRYGGTKATERAVAAALNWLHRHQNPDGSWSIENYHQNCKYGKCDGPGTAKSDSGATALGLLPFLGAGQTHMNEGMYRRNVKAALDWLISHQKPNGDLSHTSPHVMYSHGLAAIALCEAYAMTSDSRIMMAAQNAIRFIETAQNKNDGGWRYKPGDPGDTSVVGWQLMALKSGQMAKLQVNQATLDGVQNKWLPSVGKGDYAGIYRYQPEREGFLPSMTAVGLLCKEYLGCAKADPGLNEGIDYLMKHMPDADKARNIYYWYYATQTIHHVLGDRWDKWNRAMRKILVETQVKGNGCDAGSWDYRKPSADAWGNAGGRLMVTSLSCLTLEVYYRHLPLHDLDKEGPVKGKDSGKKKGGEKKEKKEVELSGIAQAD
jgi:hypothetical protein